MVRDFCISCHLPVFYGSLVFTVDEVSPTHRQFQGAPQKAKDTFVLVILSRAILELQGLVNGFDFAIPCLVRLWTSLTHSVIFTTSETPV